VASVKATASQLEITRTQKSAADFLRGFAGPADMLVHYKELLAKQFSAKESGRLLGLVLAQGETPERTQKEESEFLDYGQEADRCLLAVSWMR